MRIFHRFPYRTAADADTGFYDRINRFLIDRLPGYDHVFETGNFRRIIQEIRDGKNACCVSLYKSAQREGFAAFSRPVVVVLPNGVIIRRSEGKKFRPYMNAEGGVSLEKILESGRVVLGVAKGRVYAGGIDDILDKKEYRERIFERGGEDVFKGLLSMLLHGRLDCILGYPTEARYLSRKIGGDKAVTFLPVAETTGRYTLGYVGCPDTPWGNGVIQKVDAILGTPGAGDAFLGFYEEWLAPETVPLYRKIAAGVLEK